MSQLARSAAVDALFAQGLAAFREGAWDRSSTCLAQLLILEPRHFDALHLAGLVASRQGAPQRAVEFIERALRENATVAAAHRHLGNALRDAGRVEAALASYGRALELKPAFKEALVNRALVRLSARQPAEALQDLDRAIALGADDAEVHTFRSSALVYLKRGPEAIASADRALAWRADAADALVNRAAGLYLLERYPEALESCDRALAVQPTHAPAHARRGAVLYALRRIAEAAESLDSALGVQPHDASSHNLRALCWLDLERPDLALESSERAIALEPDLAEAHNTRGLALTEMERFDAADSSSERAMTLRPDLDAPFFNKGINRLRAGDYATGWMLYERRPLRRPPLALDQPEWTGPLVPGERLLLYSEQGLGDTLQFCRFAVLLAARGARITLAVQASLRALLQTLDPGIQVIAWEHIAAQPYDRHCALLSVPRILGLRLEDLPAVPVPYLAAQPERVAHWRSRLQVGERLIGIRWQGSTGRADVGRSFPLRHFDALSRIPGVRLVSLQRGAGAEQLTALSGSFRVEDLGADFEPPGPDAFLDVAAVMQCLHLVITSDTSIAHLAGALGRPTWVALKRVPDWRWLVERSDCPWYPTVRLFRQPRAGDWASVFQAMTRELSGVPAVPAVPAVAPSGAAERTLTADEWFEQANTSQRQGAHDEAVAGYAAALALQPRFAAARNNRGHSLRELHRPLEALADFDAALALRPAYALALNNRGLALLDLKRLPEALASFDRALEAEPDLLAALSNRGTTLLAAKRPAEAASAFERLRAMAPQWGGVLGNLLQARRQICDWHDFGPLTERVTAAVQRGELQDVPHSFLGVADSPALQLACAEAFSRTQCAGPATSPPRVHRTAREAAARGRPERIRVAYLSADFGEHAVSYLLAGVFERHDRDRFEVAAVSWGRGGESPMRRRLEAAFEHFIDVSEASDVEVVRRLRDFDADVAVDLTGHTAGQRTGIFALRPAPVQVNFLGYPGTLGSPAVDYLIADRYLIPSEERAHYRERVVHLPDCFQANDDRRSRPAAVTRAEAGLPADGFVWCALHGSLKLNPTLFEVWARLLRAQPDSVLWLQGGDAVLEANLRREALARGVAAHRLVFANVLPYERHLARLPNADLALDTLPFNGGTTTSDLLWAGVPVLTCAGRSFAARMSGSLLHALAVPELVTESLGGYEDRALALACDPARLRALRDKLARHRTSAPLFDTDRYRRHLEAAFEVMVKRARAGLAPESFDVPPHDRVARA